MAEKGYGNPDKFIVKKEDADGFEVSGECHRCAWKFGDDFLCEAFPTGIPDEILSGEKLHREVRDDQVGEYVFSERV